MEIVWQSLGKATYLRKGTEATEDKLNNAVSFFSDDFLPPLSFPLFPVLLPSNHFKSDMSPHMGSTLTYRVTYPGTCSSFYLTCETIAILNDR